VNNTEKGDLLRLAESVSVDLLEEKKSLHDILLSCKQISKTLRVSDENFWIELELNGYLVRYKTRDQLYDNLPNYRKTDWRFHDLYGNMISLPPDITDLFGKSIVYHSVLDLENSNQIIIGNQFFEKFNKFIADHGMDYVSKTVRIHEARVSKNEINQVLTGLKLRIQEFLDVVISILEFG
jgi:hypothetical protein